MYGAGLSFDLRDSTYFVQAGGQKNLGQDPALREEHDPCVAERHKGEANTLRRNLKALFWLFSLDQTLERAKRESSASCETQLLLPAMFRVSVSQTWYRRCDEVAEILSGSRKDDFSYPTLDFRAMWIDRIADSLACEPGLVGNDFFDLREFGEDDLGCAHKLVTPCHAGFRWNRAVALQSFALDRDL